MNHSKHEDFFLLLNEWKDIVDGASTDFTTRELTKSKIDLIIAELKKPKTHRDISIVEHNINELKKEKGIRKYVESSSNIIIELCNSN